MLLFSTGISVSSVYLRDDIARILGETDLLLVGVGILLRFTEALLVSAILAWTGVVGGGGDTRGVAAAVRRAGDWSNDIFEGVFVGFRAGFVGELSKTSFFGGALTDAFPGDERGLFAGVARPRGSNSVGDLLASTTHVLHPEETRFFAIFNGLIGVFAPLSSSSSVLSLPGPATWLCVCVAFFGDKGGGPPLTFLAPLGAAGRRTGLARSPATGRFSLSIWGSPRAFFVVVAALGRPRPLTAAGLAAAAIFFSSISRARARVMRTGGASGIFIVKKRIQLVSLQ